MEFREIPGYIGYRAGTDGSIWTCWKRRGHGWRYGTTPILSSQWRKLKPFKSSRGYLRYTLVCDGRKRLVAGQILVLEAFIGLRPDGMEACHCDGNPGNNALTNLRWDTHSENEKDKVSHGRTAKGSKSSRAKLLEEDVLRIRSRYSEGVTCATMAREYGLSDSAIRMIVKRKRWSHI